MLLRKNVKFWGLLFSLAAFFTSAQAHQVEVSEDVGATIHIEPNDTPRAGKTNLTWFALTRRGGQIIPLATCECELELYKQPYRVGDSPIAKPELKAVSAEGFNGIPGADVIFPQAGGYEFVLRGSPIISGDFAPFELRFPITVAR